MIYNSCIIFLWLTTLRFSHICVDESKNAVIAHVYVQMFIEPILYF